LTAATVSNHDPLDLIEAHLIAPPVVKRVEAWFAIAAFSSEPPF
jgi:hypothetical protein